MSGVITDVPFWNRTLYHHSEGPFEKCNPLSILIPILHNNSNNSNKINNLSNNNISNEPINELLCSEVGENNIKENANNNTINNNNNNKDQSIEKCNNNNIDLSSVTDTTIRLLQHIMMYITPLDSMRYILPAMSISNSSSCVVTVVSDPSDSCNNNSNDNIKTRIITNGSIIKPTIPIRDNYKYCVCGDTFVALLRSDNTVKVAGYLDDNNNNNNIINNTNNNQIENNNIITNKCTLREVAKDILYIHGHGSQLLALTKSLTLLPISSLSANTRTIIPYRSCKYITSGLINNDAYMVGHDNILYKFSASLLAIGTPRRVMTIARIGVSRVAAGAGFIIIIDIYGRVYTLGKNKRGQLGNGKLQDSMRRPYLHSCLSHHYIIAAAAGDCHSIILTSSGEAYGCGANDCGQLGMGREIREVLTFKKINLPDFCSSICAGPKVSLFACRDGKVYGCGANECDALGINNNNNEGNNDNNIPCFSSVLDYNIYYPTAMQGVRYGIVEMTKDDILNSMVTRYSYSTPSVNNNNNLNKNVVNSNVKKEKVCGCDGCCGSKGKCIVA